MSASNAPRIFISYRRDDSAGWTGRLAADLRERFGPTAVFWDIETIDAGEDFVAAINRELESCAVALVVIGPTWAAIADAEGVPRLNQSGDFVRLEVATTLKRRGLRVIPVLVGGATMPDAQHLPTDLQDLAKRQAFEISDGRWSFDVDRLVKSVAKTLGWIPWILSRRGPLMSGAAAVAALGVFTVFLSWPDGAIDRPPTLGEFSIDRPANKELIPLVQGDSWIIEGRLRGETFTQSGQGTPKIAIEVFRLPDRQSIPQDGRVRVSTERGLWRFESAKFDGAGTYEVVATLALGDKNDFHSVVVDCRPKADVYTQLIDVDRAQRGAPKVERGPRAAGWLAALKTELYRLQSDFWSAYRDRQDLDAAQAVLVRTFDLLDPAIPLFSDDIYLQNARAFAFKNYALVMRDRGNHPEFERALAESERMFAAVRQQSPEDAVVWNGLGSVAALRNDPVRALEYIDRALELEPNYPEARADREEVLMALKRRPPNR